MLIIIHDPDRLGVWRVHLTDGAAVYDRRRFRTAWRALEAVAGHLAEGHAPAFKSAFDELVVAACDRAGDEAAA